MAGLVSYIFSGTDTLQAKVGIGPVAVIIGRFGGGPGNDEAMDKKLSELSGR